MADDTARPWKCRRLKCNKAFSHQSTRATHEKSCKNGAVTKPPKSVYTCPNVFCKKKNKIYASKYSLSRHLITCKQTVKTQYICQEAYCGRIFAKPCQLTRHMESHNKPTYTCEHCCKEYTRRDKFEDHQAICSTAPPALEPTFPSMAMGNVIEDGQGNCSEAPAVEEAPVDFNAEVGGSLLQNDSTDLDSGFGEQAASTAFLNLSSNSVTEQLGSMSIQTAYCNTEETQPDVYILDEMLGSQPSEQLDDNNATAESCCSESEHFSCPTEVSVDFEGEITQCTISYLKTLKHQSKRSSIKLQEFAKMCTLLFSHKFDDIDFMDMLADELGFMDKASFLDFINLDRIQVNRKSRGRPMSHIVNRQTMYD